MQCRPTVSFIVPCYNLAHYLSECIQSILSQTYTNFEVLIMDDCSPDDTRYIATSFCDPRIVYIRNQENLGHLANYNKGISASRGRYIWLISADDRLRSSSLLDRYVTLMDNQPTVGYSCCPAMKLEGGQETRIEGCLTTRDTIFDGQTFLRILLKGNCIIAASGMVRRDCYEKCGAFPLDLPYSGDWFLWCLFALQYQIAYFAEPMVNYRTHELSMTNYLMNHRSALALKEGFLVLWRVRRQAQEVGTDKVVRLCAMSLASLYARHLIGGRYESWAYGMTEEDMESSLTAECVDQADRDWIKARTWKIIGDRNLSMNNLAAAAICYKRAVRYDNALASAWLKLLILRTGGARGVDFARGLWRLRKVAVK